ncbi:hypothetical protein KI387_035014, partial [Taxus chinensis]
MSNKEVSQRESHLNRNRNHITRAPQIISLEDPLVNVICRTKEDEEEFIEPKQESEEKPVLEIKEVEDDAQIRFLDYSKGEEEDDDDDNDAPSFS